MKTPPTKPDNASVPLDHTRTTATKRAAREYRQVAEDAYARAAHERATQRAALDTPHRRQTRQQIKAQWITYQRIELAAGRDPLNEKQFTVWWWSKRRRAISPKNG